MDDQTGSAARPRPPAVFLSRFWRSARAPALSRRASSRKLDLWITILSAKGIPFRVGGAESPGAPQGFTLFVPPLQEKLARSELAAVAAEKKLPLPPPPPVRRNAHWVLAALLMLIAWHGLRMGWWGGLPEATPRLWLEAGAADGFRILRGHEWYRTLTALTLHADSEHLFANVLFGAPFLILLCRHAGLGLGIALAVVSGTLGNVLNTLYQPIGHSSIGFSTALFGTVGALSGLLAGQGPRTSCLRLRWRQALLLLAAGSGILALLGTDGARTDYGAHLFGLLSGFLAGGAAGLLPPPSRRAEAAAGAAALLLVGGAWWLALHAG